MLTPGKRRARRRPRRRRVVPRGAADPRRVPAQAAAAVRPRQRGRRRRPLGARRRRGRRPATAWRRSAGWAGLPRWRRARVLLLRAPRRARLRPGRQPRAQLPHRLLRAAHCAAGSRKGRRCSCRARPAASAPRRCRSPRGSAHARSAVVSSDDKERVAREAGADEVVRSDGPWKDQAKEISGGGVDVVLDPVGGDRFTDSLRSLREGGRVVVVGFTGGSIPEVRVNRLLLNNTEVVGAGWGAGVMTKPDVDARDRRRDRRPDRARGSCGRWSGRGSRSSAPPRR